MYYHENKDSKVEYEIDNIDLIGDSINQLSEEFSEKVSQESGSI